MNNRHAPHFDLCSPTKKDLFDESLWLSGQIRDSRILEDEEYVFENRIAAIENEMSLMSSLERLEIVAAHDSDDQILDRQLYLVQMPDTIHQWLHADGWTVHITHADEPLPPYMCLHAAAGRAVWMAFFQKSRFPDSVSRVLLQLARAGHEVRIWPHDVTVDQMRNDLIPPSGD